MGGKKDFGVKELEIVAPYIANYSSSLLQERSKECPDASKVYQSFIIRT